MESSQRVHQLLVTRIDDRSSAFGGCGGGQRHGRRCDGHAGIGWRVRTCQTERSSARAASGSAGCTRNQRTLIGPHLARMLVPMKLRLLRYSRICLGLAAAGAVLLLLVMGWSSPVDLPRADATYGAILVYSIWIVGLSTIGLLLAALDGSGLTVGKLVTVFALVALMIPVVALSSRIFGTL
jgi:hypothetical protein